MKSSVDAAIAAAHAACWSRLTSTLARQFRDLDLAEEVTQDAFVTALDTWSRSGTPDNPFAWLLTVARRKALDRVRRESAFARTLPLLIVPEGEADDPPGADPFTDDQLRLIFTCCHPAIAPEARVALSLRLICGLETAAIARLFIVPVPTMAARITRAKKKIAAAGIAYRVPDRDELPARLPTVLSTIYLLFTAGHTAPSGESLTSPELSWRALDLARLVCTLMPGEPEVLGLFALIRLSDSRRATRTDERGRLILLADQDRSRWDRSAIAEGTAALERSLAMTRGPLPGAFALQAAIEAVHLEATSFDETDWRQLDALYGLLHDVAPSPLVRLNRAVVVAKLAGPEAALDELDRIRGWSGGSHYHLRAMTRAELLRQSGRMDEAAAEYSKALALPQNDAERAFIVERLAEIS